eukprot:1905985-Pleurochrysis_carterae.AAC.2
MSSHEHAPLRENAVSGGTLRVAPVASPCARLTLMNRRSQSSDALHWKIAHPWNDDLIMHNLSRAGNL